MPKVSSVVTQDSIRKWSPEHQYVFKKCVFGHAVQPGFIRASATERIPMGRWNYFTRWQFHMNMSSVNWMEMYELNHKGPITAPRSYKLAKIFSLFSQTSLMPKVRSVLRRTTFSCQLSMTLFWCWGETGEITVLKSRLDRQMRSVNTNPKGNRPKDSCQEISIVTNHWTPTTAQGVWSMLGRFP